MNTNLRHLFRKIYYWLSLNSSRKTLLKRAFFAMFFWLSSSTNQASLENESGGHKSTLRNLLRAAYLKFPLSDYYKFQIASTLFGFSPSLFRSLPEFQRWETLAGKSARPWDSLPKFSADPAASNDVHLPTSPTPQVSVIIPVYGKIAYTLMCLRSIVDCSIKVSFEVIVVDDCSPDNTLATLQKISGIRVISNPSNQGFIRSCNAGAAAAHGQYLCFLNNDTQVCEGWLDELLGTFDNYSGVGIPGSKLVYPNGKLQEAGGIVWRADSAWNFGRGDDPCAPMFNYAREVDYISGASILIKKLFLMSWVGLMTCIFPPIAKTPTSH